MYTKPNNKDAPMLELNNIRNNNMNFSKPRKTYNYIEHTPARASGSKASYVYVCNYVWIGYLPNHGQMFMNVLGGNRKTRFKTKLVTRFRVDPFSSGSISYREIVSK